MSNQQAEFQKVIDESDRHHSLVNHIFHRVLHILEHTIAAITIIVLVIAMCATVYELVVEGAFNGDVSNFLHHILTIVVGLEFVRMIIDTTPASILEVLTVAITRHVILSHDDPLSNLACIACIAGLFATRRFLIRHEELKEDLSETD